MGVPFKLCENNNDSCWPVMLSGVNLGFSDNSQDKF